MKKTVFWVFAAVVFAGAALVVVNRGGSPAETTRPATAGIEACELGGVTLETVAEDVAQPGIETSSEQPVVETVERSAAPEEEQGVGSAAVGVALDPESTVTMPLRLGATGATMSEAERAELVARHVLFNSDRPLAELRRDPRALVLRQALLDTRAAQLGRTLEIPEVLRAAEGTQRHIAILAERVNAETTLKVERSGVKVDAFLPNQAFAVTGDAAAIAALAATEAVVHIEPYHPYFKLSHELIDFILTGGNDEAKRLVESDRFSAILYADAEIEDLRAMGVEVASVRPLKERTLVATISGARERLVELAASDAVRWIEPVYDAQPMDDLSDTRTRAAAVKFRYENFTGSNLVVAVLDSGVDVNHLAFARDPSLPMNFATRLNTRIRAYAHRPGRLHDGVLGDADGHGTAVAGALLGGGALSPTAPRVPGSGVAPYAARQFRGILPDAELVMIEDAESFSAVEATTFAVQHGAVIINNSWGEVTTFYSVRSAEWDALVRDANPDPLSGVNPLITFFAAGNTGAGNDFGTGGSAISVVSPGNAKNIISIGALEQPRWANNLPTSIVETDTDWQVSRFSSRGPTRDGRIKPDIMAPGSYVVSAESRDLRIPYGEAPFPSIFPNRDYSGGASNHDTGPNYASLSGTSIASPLAAGAAGVLYQAFVARYGQPPSPAMMKAMMVAGADAVQSMLYSEHFPLREPMPPVDDGWGMLNVARALDGPESRGSDQVRMYDEDRSVNGLAANDFEMRYPVGQDHQGPLAVTIAWTDEPGEPAADIVLVNDLNLVVHAPDGRVYMGNWMGRRGWGSSSSWIAAADYARETVMFHDAWGDRVNNVEKVLIPYTVQGTYIIQVRGHQVQTPQRFAMVIQQGGDAIGHPLGGSPALAIQSDGTPVMAYIGGPNWVYDYFESFPAIQRIWTTRPDRQVFVRRWHGLFGHGNELSTWQRLEGRWGLHQMGDVEVEAVSALVLGRTPYEPAIALGSGNRPFVAWREDTNDDGVPDNDNGISVRFFDGTRWVGMGGSDVSRGIVRAEAKNLAASRPRIGVGHDGQPIVAYIQNVVDANLTVSPPVVRVSAEVVVKRFNGTEWRGMDGSVDGYVLPGIMAYGLDLAIDSAGRPVVLFAEVQPTRRLACYRWNGSSWQQVGGSLTTDTTLGADIGLSVDGANLYATWTQVIRGGAPVEVMNAARVARSTGGGWSDVGNTAAYPGISNGQSVSIPRVSAAGGHVALAWQENEHTNRVFQVRRLLSGQTSWNVPQTRGTVLGGTGHGNTLSSLAINAFGLPVVAGVSTRIGFSEPIAYGLVGPMAAPIFAGIQSATGTQSNSVWATWFRAVDLSRDIDYLVYRSPQSWAPDDAAMPPPDDPALIAAVFATTPQVVRNRLSYEWTGLTVNRIYYFGVRARNAAGLTDSNTRLIAAGPYDLLGDPDKDWLPTWLELQIGTSPLNPDTSGDGMWDGWVWFYSNLNTNRVNGLNLDPTRLYLDPRVHGDMNPYPNTGPNDDMDGDGLLNIEEFRYWRDRVWRGRPYDTVLPAEFASWWTQPQHWWLDPTASDTDGDGLPDGWEWFAELDPGDAADANRDADGDGLSNRNEHTYGSHPRLNDSNYNGIQDGAEVALGAFPGASDGDSDGLDDDLELTLGSRPTNPDSSGSDVPDGLEYQLGWNPGDTNNLLVVPIRDLNGNLLFETADRPTHTFWLQATNRGLWHRTLTDPAPLPPPVGTLSLTPLHNPTRGHAFRCAVDSAPFTNVVATYLTAEPGSLHGGVISFMAALDSPTFNAQAHDVAGLYLSWNEFFETEPQADLCQVFVSRDNGVNWILVSTDDPNASGFTPGWRRRMVSLNDFRDDTEVRVRFQMIADNKNNSFRGWWVDDIKIFGMGVMTGTVRDVTGRPLIGATVTAIGARSLTNRINGHSYVFPGTVVSTAITDQFGRYRLNRLWRGSYHLKAEAPGYAAEFYDGRLFSGPTYARSFGLHDRPGVVTVDRVVSGRVDAVMHQTQMASYDFELMFGASRSRIAVVYTNEARAVYLNQYARPALNWDGQTNAPGIATNRVRGYTTRDYATGLPFVDYENAPGLPKYFDALAPGNHQPWLHPAWPEMGWIPMFRSPDEGDIRNEGLSLRSGEITKAYFFNRQHLSRLSVRANHAGYRIRINGRDTGLTTLRMAPVEFSVGEGFYIVTLDPPAGGQSFIVAPKVVRVPLVGRGVVVFNDTDLLGATGRFVVSTVDVKLNPVTNAAVFVNGVRLGVGNALDGATNTPATVLHLRPGRHFVSVYRDGYTWSAVHSMRAVSAETVEATFTLAEADLDYDGVGDALEIEGYGEISRYSRSDDPDRDGLTSGLEYEMFLLYAIRLNIFNPDTERDGLSDSAEVGWDGDVGSYGRSTLHDQALIETSFVDARFVGKFLDGVSGLPHPAAFAGGVYGETGAQLGIEGDSFFTTNAVWLASPDGTPFIRYTLPRSGPAWRVLSISHARGASIYSDTHPGVQDTEGDGMWDGYEVRFGERTTLFDWTSDPQWRLRFRSGRPDLPAYRNIGIDPLDAGRTAEDPDFDDLINLSEFHGRAGTPSLNGWTRPDIADTDGDDMPDGWELKYRAILDPLNPADAFLDTDNDGLINLDEFRFETHPSDPDTDNDFVLDGPEVHRYKTGPLNADTDSDGLLDGWEVFDRDGVWGIGNPPDGGFFPNWDGGDMDGDGFMDGPTDYDTDGDGIPDWFEVMDAFGNIRPPGATLDPSNPADAHVDHDGDGLTALEEWLILDNRFGNRPSSFGFPTFIDPIWHTPTDPFIADTDGDGMPDGYEAFFGLHPIDPLPLDTNRYSEVILSRMLWIFGDPEGDGVVNRTEYNYRFVRNRTADAYSIDGSLHPWVRDTDGDGLLDGEEIKMHRSDALLEDTSGGGLFDGQGSLTVQGKVRTSRHPGAIAHHDRALNDFWSLSTPAPPFPPDTLQWRRIQPDQDVLYAWIFLANANGYVVMDMTDVPFYRDGPNAGESQEFENWSIGADGAEYTNVEVLELTEPEPPFDPWSEWLVFRFSVTTAGNYGIRFWAQHAGAPGTDPYAANSFWARLGTGPWQLMTVDADARVWTSNTPRIVRRDPATRRGAPMDFILPLQPGLHTIMVSGRSAGVRLHSAFVYNAATVSPATLVPDNPVRGDIPMLPIPIIPRRRWDAAAGARMAYLVRDDIHGTYVGRITESGIAAVNQILLSGGAFVLFGGRDGARTLREMWQFRDGLWEAASDIGFFTNPRVHLNVPIGYTGVAATGLRYVLTHPSDGGFGPRQIGRPRPGSLPLYRYYDGNPDSPPISIWGAAGQENASDTFFITGWDPPSSIAETAIRDLMYLYKGGNHYHDAVEQPREGGVGIDPYTTVDFDWWYQQPDDDVEIQFAWRQESDAFQIDPQLPGASDAWMGMVAIGSMPGTNIFTGLNFGPVYFTAHDVGNMAGLTATLTFRVGTIPIAAPFDVEIVSELAEELGPTGESSTEHWHLSSPIEYNSLVRDQRPSARSGRPVWVRDPFGNLIQVPGAWPFVSAPIRRTIPATAANGTFTIDVSEPVRAALSATRNQRNWASGARIGFVIMGLDARPGMGWLSENAGVLDMSLTIPPWLRPGGVIRRRPSVNPIPHPRKHSDMAYDYDNNQFVIFGGIDGVRALGDTWVSNTGNNWTIRYPATRPPERWGHNMVSVGPNASSVGKVLMFGGFDKWNEPMNDLWVWDGTNWEEVKAYFDDSLATGERIFLREIPPPRGGAHMALVGGYPALFGGTDGKRYLGDTWWMFRPGEPVIQRLPDGRLASRWVLCIPDGQNDVSPPVHRSPAPRAFGAMAENWVIPNFTDKRNHALLFGGRAGALPTATDTDGDWVDDGLEVALGGPTAGRNPVIHPHIHGLSIFLPEGPAETMPYSFFRLGGVLGLTLPVADFEQEMYPHSLSDEEVERANTWGWPIPRPYAGTAGPTDFVADSPFDSQQWFSRYGFGTDDPWGTDPRNVWQHGVPYPGAGLERAVPSRAASGIYVMGTALSGNYPNNTISTLYSPLLRLGAPNLRATDFRSVGDWWLVFNEWVDLADQYDTVRVEAIRPISSLEITRRLPGVSPSPDIFGPTGVLTLLARRNNAANTQGEWRRTFVRMPIREPNVFLRFVLESNQERTAGGWYLDDVAILHAGEVRGMYTAGARVFLEPADGPGWVMQVRTAAGGAYVFDMLPAGRYNVTDGNQRVGPVQIGPGSWGAVMPTFEALPLVIDRITPLTAGPLGMELRWNSVEGRTYVIQYTTPAQIAGPSPWTTLGRVTASGTTSTFTDGDYGRDPSRLYRIVELE